jgi:hypothetical protein
MLFRRHGAAAPVPLLVVLGLVLVLLQASELTAAVAGSPAGEAAAGAGAAQAGPGGRVARGRHIPRKELADYWPPIKWLLIVIFAPPVVYFFASIATDPTLPGIMKRAGQVLRERFTVYLGPTPKYKRR